MLLQGNVHGGVPGLILSIDVAAGTHQQEQQRHVSLGHCQVQWQLVTIVADVHITAALQAEVAQSIRFPPGISPIQAHWLRSGAHNELQLNQSTPPQLVSWRSPL